MNWRDKHMWGLLAAHCATFAAATAQSLWWYLATSAVLLLALTLARRKMRAVAVIHEPALSSGTVLSLVIYAALASIALITVRAALGWLEMPVHPFEQLSLPRYMQSSPLGFYDKSEMRLVLYEVLLFTIVLGLSFVRSAEVFALKAARRVALRPETAAFAVVLYFATAYSPPYANFNLAHWLPFIAGATAIQHGVWPYFSGFDFSYGLLCLAFLAIWLSLFGLSSLSLSAVIMASDLVCGLATFALIRRLTGSRLIALLGASYLLFEATDTLAVTSTFRAPIQIALGSLLLYGSLRDRDARIRSGFLFGLCVLWNPTFGAFAAAGYALAHAYRVRYAPLAERETHIKAIFSMLAGIVLPLMAIWLYTGPGESRLAAFYAGSGGNLFLLGYANLAQRFDGMSLAAAILAVLYVATALYRSSRSRRMTIRSLFVGASLIAAIPYVMYALGRSDWTHQLAAHWALMPSMVLIFYGLVRLLSLRRGPLAVQRIPIHKRMGLTTTALCVALFAFFPVSKLVNSIGGYTTGSEVAKQKWYTDCAAGGQCNVEAKPTLRNNLRQASQPQVSIDPAIAAACRAGVDILSYNDALFYYAGNCFPSTGLPTVNLLVTKAELDWYIDRIGTRPQVIFDTGKNVFAVWKGDMLAEIKSRLLKLGFSEWPACKQLTILSKADPAPLVRKICG
jgi:hypothetical protein